MPFIPHTPESLIQRSDSKDPGSTCKGITSAGRPCRRPLGSSPQQSPTGNGKSKRGVIAVLQPSDEDHEGAAAYFCWQHKDQAEALAGGDQDGRKANIVPVQQRTSIDTLVDRTGVLDFEDNETPSKSRRKRSHARPARKETLPKKWRDVDGPLIAVSGEKQRPAGKGTHRHQAREQSNLSFSLFCCVSSADRDSAPPPRVQQYAEKHEYPHASAKVPSSMLQAGRPAYSRPTNSHPPVGQPSGSPRPSPVAQGGIPTTNSRPPAQQHRSSHTQDLLSLIPTNLSPQTTSFLLTELAKPVSPHDEEGYLYMFWLTDNAVCAPDPQAASSLLSDGAASTPNGRCNSDVLAQNSTHRNASSKPKTMLLKIGRASNVQRRMNEWNRQCGYNLSLIRFYPYLPSSPLSSRPNASSPPASPSTPHKVPHAHKVERLIHLELAEQRVKRDCESCGKEHREWFEVESSREGLREVDEVIRRWTEWGRKAGG
ncbi:MAG: hypothetical protein ALECFALPRED_003493 [Alectoria fallacina]|uniref:Bacteriophage T5 Orf172 DNA-binding domain-containing protein n=1 Tax=Alectoria fallacina TaxID=1903189 RepID=A0A8H3FMR4_9LECA|nr:MAG: hypothetical protein ALECFALPRED_003493 [Alectoria fallacina]